MQDDHTSVARANRLGALAMVSASFCFIVNDGLIKYVSQTLPPAQLIFIRGAMASALVLAVAQAMGATERIREIARGWVASYQHPFVGRLDQTGLFFDLSDTPGRVQGPPKAGCESR